MALARPRPTRPRSVGDRRAMLCLLDNPPGRWTNPPPLLGPRVPPPRGRRGPVWSSAGRRGPMSSDSSPLHGRRPVSADRLLTLSTVGRPTAASPESTDRPRRTGRLARAKTSGSGQAEPPLGHVVVRPSAVESGETPGKVPLAASSSLCRAARRGPPEDLSSWGRTELEHFGRAGEERNF